MRRCIGKRTISFMLSVFMIVSLFAVCGISASAATKKDLTLKEWSAAELIEAAKQKDTKNTKNNAVCGAYYPVVGRKLTSVFNYGIYGASVVFGSGEGRPIYDGANICMGLRMFVDDDGYMEGTICRFDIKTMNESIYYTVDYIHEAINNNVKVSFQYFSWNVKKEKVLRHYGDRFIVSPWALTWDDENYYMIGYDSMDGIVKHYRVDKMLKLELTEEKRDGAELFKNFDMALYSKKTFGMYGGKEETVTLRCNNKIAGVIIDRFGMDIPFTNVTDTHFEIRIKVHTSPLFFTWLMTFGADITVLSPDHVIDGYVKLAHEGLKQYE